MSGIHDPRQEVWRSFIDHELKAGNAGVVHDNHVEFTSGAKAYGEWACGYALLRGVPASPGSRWERREGHGQ
jgi:hypothetical protein